MKVSNNKYEIINYSNTDNKCPIMEFIDSLKESNKAKKIRIVFIERMKN